MKKSANPNGVQCGCGLLAGAAAFLFAGGALMIAADEAKDIFLTVLPVISAIVPYWFAGRSTDKSKSGNSGSGN